MSKRATAEDLNKPITGHFKPDKKVIRGFKKQLMPENVVPAPRASGAFPARFAKYAARFTKNLLADNKFWSRMNSIPNGVIIAVQAFAGIAAVALAAPLALHVAGVAGCALLAGIGAYAIGNGFLLAWKSMEGICERSFPRFNPPRKFRKFLQRVTRKPVQSRPGQKVVRGLRKLPNLKPRQQEAFLAAVTLEGASAAAIYLGIHTYAHVAALPALTVGNLLTAGMVGALYIGTACAFDVFSCTKTLFQINKERRQEKKAKALAVLAPSAQEARNETAFEQVTAAFNGEAGPHKAAKSAATAPTAASQAPKPHLA